jgi:autotransporter-associated beta strand protein
LVDDGTVNFSESSSGSASFSGTLSGDGTLVQSGAGILDVSGATSAFDGALIISAGEAALLTSNGLASGSIDFQPGAVSAILQIGALDLPANGGTLAPTIEDFDNTLDGLDLSLAYSAGATATVSGSTLMLSDGARTVYFKLGGTFASNFSVSTDGEGGTLVTPTYTQPAMLFAQSIAAMSPARANTVGTSPQSVASSFVTPMAVGSGAGR